jgi:hypothetical protein
MGGRGGIAPSSVGIMALLLSVVGGTMHRMIATAVLATAVTFAPALASAQERAGDAALGAISGAVVAGPIGLVAGGVVGWTAGPSIARSWGLHRPHRYGSARPPKPVHREANRSSDQR